MGVQTKIKMINNYIYYTLLFLLFNIVTSKTFLNQEKINDNYVSNLQANIAISTNISSNEVKTINDGANNHNLLPKEVILTYPIQDSEDEDLFPLFPRTPPEELINTPPVFSADDVMFLIDRIKMGNKSLLELFKKEFKYHVAGDGREIAYINSRKIILTYYFGWYSN